MTESQFVEQNKEKWKELESLLLQNDRDADKLQSLFVKVSSDLSYARTFYPNRSVRLYLNNLTLRVFDLITKQNKKNRLGQMVHFFKDVLPFEIYHSRKAFVVSFLIFFTSVLIGIISSVHNPDFAEVILGPEYMSMTEENINNGDPMAVYKDSDQVDMFFGITINNIKVAFIAFILGLFGSIGTVIILLSNGIMLGAFQYFFYSKGLFMTSFLTIWIHGTIEISAIILAGAAGIILGNGLIFPGTYKRSAALLINAKRSLRIILGTVPLFVIAGLLESFVTRKTELPDLVKLGIIGFSAFFIIAMWVIYPIYRHRTRDQKDSSLDILPTHIDHIKFDKYKLRTFSQIIAKSFTQFRLYFGINVKYVILPSVIIASILYWIRLQAYEVGGIDFTSALSLFKHTDGALFLFLFYWFMTAYMFTIIGFFSSGEIEHKDGLSFFKLNFIPILLIALIVCSAFYFLPFWAFLLVVGILTPQFIVYSVEMRSDPNYHALDDYKNSYFLSLRSYVFFLIPIGISAFFYWIAIVLASSGLVSFVVHFFQWHNVFEAYYSNQVFISHILLLLIFLSMFPLFYFLLVNQYYSEASKLYAIDLKKRMESFGLQKSNG